MKESTFLFIKMQLRLVETPEMLIYEQQDILKIPERRCVSQRRWLFTAQKKKKL